MFSVITTAPSNKVLEAVSGTMLGNRKISPNIRYAGKEEGKDAIIVTVEPWAGSILVAALRKMGAWYDRVMPKGKVPTGKPIVSYAGASQVRNQKRKQRKAA